MGKLLHSLTQVFTNCQASVSVFTLWPQGAEMSPLRLSVLTMSEYDARKLTWRRDTKGRFMPYLP